MTHFPVHHQCVVVQWVLTNGIWIEVMCVHFPFLFLCQLCTDNFKDLGGSGIIMWKEVGSLHVESLHVRKLPADHKYHHWAFMWMRSKFSLGWTPGVWGLLINCTDQLKTSIWFKTLWLPDPEVLIRVVTPSHVQHGISRISKEFSSYDNHSGFPWWLRGKESACSVGAVGDRGSIPGSGRSLE